MADREISREEVMQLFGFKPRTLRRRIEGGQLKTAGGRRKNGRRKRHVLLLRNVLAFARKEGRTDVVEQLTEGAKDR